MRNEQEPISYGEAKADEQAAYEAEERYWKSDKGQAELAIEDKALSRLHRDIKTHEPGNAARDVPQAHGQAMSRPGSSFTSCVDSDDACPVCREDDQDNLIWVGEDHVKCQRCGAVYSPPAKSDNYWGGP